MFFEDSIQHVDPFFSENIQKGNMWLPELNKAIDDTSVAILCITSDNYKNPWLIFEAGALSRVGIVCPLLFNISKKDLSSLPISAYQASDFTKKEFKKLFESINIESGANLKQHTIDRQFNDMWNNLEIDIVNIIKEYSLTEDIHSKTIFLLKDINKKLDKITNNSDTYIDIKYLENLLDSMAHLIEKLSNNFLKDNVEIFLNIMDSIDFIIAEFSSKISMNDILIKFKDLRTKVDNLNL